MKHGLWQWKRSIAALLIVFMITPDVSGIVAYANPDSKTVEDETVIETEAATETEEESESPKDEETESEIESEEEQVSESETESVEESISYTEITEETLEEESESESVIETENILETEIEIEALAETASDSNIRYIYGRELTEEEIAEIKAMEPKYLPEINMPKVPELKSDKTYLKDNLPAFYDAREENVITSVKNQNPHGTCWTFGSISAMETSMILQNLADVDNIDVSERHLAYFSRHTGTDELGNANQDTITTSGTAFLEVGGNVYDFSMKMLNWHGGARESDFPYSAVTQDIAVSAGQTSDVAHLKNAYIVSTEANNAESRALIKSLIYKYKCIASSYYSDSSFLNYSTAAYYNNTYTSTNHLISVVGWDDTYSKENFVAGRQPKNDGAWIVKNSWGSSWGDSGYVYISYEDVSFACGVVMAVVASSADDYDNNYFYGNTTSWTFDDGSAFAQIFTIKGKDADKEQLSAVSVMNYTTGIPYSLQIYKNPDMVNGIVQNPESGTALLATPVTGTLTYAGVNQIELPDAITVEADDVISVVFKTSNGTVMKLFSDADYNETHFVHNNVSEAGQSLRKYSTNSGWTDLHSDGESVRINLFTTDYSEEITIPEVTVSVKSQPAGFGESLEYLLKWKRCTDALSYDVLRAESVTGNYSVISNAGSGVRTYVDSIAESDWDKTFYYKIRANLRDGSTTESEAVEISTDVVLKPEMKDYFYGSSDKVTISWKQFLNADGYELQKKNSSGSFVTIVRLQGAAITSYEEDYSQADLGAYEYRIRAYKGEAYSEWSDIEIVYKDISVEQTGAYKVKVKWYPREKSYTSKLYCLTSTGWTLSLNFPWVANQYEWDLSGNVSKGHFMLGDICKFYAEVTPTSGALAYTTNKMDLLFLPEALSITGSYDEENKNVNLRWSGGNGAETIYIYRSESEDEQGELLTSFAVSDGITTFSDDVSKCGSKTFYYKVYPGVINSHDDVILGNYSSYSVAVNQKKLAANVTLTHPESFLDTADYTISWQGCNDADGYEIYKATDENGEYNRIAVVEAGESSYTDSVDLDEWNTQYYYKVNALYEGENPTVSKVVTSVELPYVSIEMPSAIYETNTIVLSWNSVAGAEGYCIERRQKGTQIFTEVTKTDSCTFYDDVTSFDLSFYEYRIMAYKGSIQSKWSELVTVAKDLKGASHSAYQIFLEWVKVTDADKYKIYIKDNEQKYLISERTKENNTIIDLQVYEEYKVGKTYNYYVEAYDGEELLYTSSQISLATKPDAISMTTSYMNDVFYVTFDGGLGADEILVYRSILENEEGNEIFATVNMDADKVEFTDDSLEYGVQKYFYHFYPASKLDNGTYVKGECLSYTLERKLEPVIGINSSSVSDEIAIAITWNDWSGADSYTLYRSETTRDNYVIHAEGISDAFYKDENVILGKTYFYKVLVNKNGLKSSIMETPESFLQLIPETPELYSEATGSEIIIKNNPSLEYALSENESDTGMNYVSGEGETLTFKVLPNNRYYIFARTKTEITGEAPVRCALPLVINTPVKVELAISSDEFVITKGNQVTYELTMKPENIHYNDTVYWTAAPKDGDAYQTITSANEILVKDNSGNEIIKITKNKIIAVGDSPEKEVYLTATKGSMKVTCRVVVNVPVTDLSWHVEEKNGEPYISSDNDCLNSLKVGDVVKIGVNYEPENADNTMVYFSSSNNDILKVADYADSSAYIRLEAISSGKCVLEAYTMDGVKITTPVNVSVAENVYAMWISDKEYSGKTVKMNENGEYFGENIDNVPEYTLDYKGESAPAAIRVSTYVLNENHATLKDDNGTVTEGTLVKTGNTYVTYVSSNPDIASVDENGMITALSNGMVSIYAYDAHGNAVYGKCTVTVTGADPVEKVKTTEYVIDKAYKISAVNASQSIENYSLNHNSSCMLQIKDQFGTIYRANEEGIYEFKFTSAKPDICMVDANGRVTPNPDYKGKKATVKITAELLDDLAKRKVTFNVTVLDKAQISDIELEFGNVDAKNGYVMERKLAEDECITQKYEKDLTMTFAATSYDSKTNAIMNPSLKWSISDSSIAKLKVNKDKTVTVTFKKAGRINLICQANDVWKTTRSVELSAMSLTPVVSTKQVTINRKLVSEAGFYESETFGILPMEGSSLALPEISSVKIGKAIYEEGSSEYDAFAVKKCEDGTYAVMLDAGFALEAKKNQVYELTLQTDITGLPSGFEEDYLSEKFVMKVKLADKEPTIKLSTPQINRLYVTEDNLRSLMILTSSDVITGVRVLSAQEGQINSFDSYFTTEYDRGQWYIRFEDTDSKYNKSSIKGKVAITVKGYGEVIKTITVKTPVTKQKIAQKAMPSIQAGISDSAYVTLYNQTSKKNLSSYVIVGENVSDQLDVTKESDGRLKLSIKDGVKVKDGATLSTTVNVMEVTENISHTHMWKEPVSVKVSIKVFVQKAPTVTMKKSTLTLNLQMPEEDASTVLDLNCQNTKFIASEQWQILLYNSKTRKYEELPEGMRWIDLRMDESTGTLYAGIKDGHGQMAAPGSYKFRITGFVEDYEEIYKDFSVKIIDAQPAVSVKVSGKLDLVNRQAVSIKGKISLKNIPSGIEEVILLNEVGEAENTYFMAEKTDADTFILKLTPEGMNAKLKTEKINIPVKVKLLGGSEIISTMSFKPTQSVPKIKIPPTQTIYKTSKELVKDYDLTEGMATGTAIKKIEIAGVPKGISAIAKDGHVIVNLNDTGIKTGTYKINVKIYFEGAQPIFGYFDGKSLGKTITVKIL